MGLCNCFGLIWASKYDCCIFRWIFYWEFQDFFSGDLNHPGTCSRMGRSQVNYKQRVSSVLEKGRENKFSGQGQPEPMVERSIFSIV